MFQKTCNILCKVVAYLGSSFNTNKIICRNVEISKRNFKGNFFVKGNKEYMETLYGNIPIFVKKLELIHQISEKCQISTRGSNGYAKIYKGPMHLVFGQYGISILAGFAL